MTEHLLRALALSLLVTGVAASLPSPARADLSFLPPWACRGAEPVTRDDREEYFDALRSAAYTLLDENAADIGARLEVYGGDLRVDVERGALLLEGTTGARDVTSLVRADLAGLRAARRVVVQQRELIERLEEDLRTAEHVQNRIWGTHLWAAGTNDRARDFAEEEMLVALRRLGRLGFRYVGDREGELVDVLAYEDGLRSGDAGALEDARIDRADGLYLLHEADWDAFLSCGSDREALRRNRFTQIAAVIEAELVSARRRMIAASWPILDAPAEEAGRPLGEQLEDLAAGSATDLRLFASRLANALRHTRAQIAATQERVGDLDVGEVHVLAASPGVAELGHEERFEDVACVVRSEIHIGWRTLLRAGGLVTGVAAMFVNPALGWALATAAAATSVADAALLFRDARRARSEWHTGYDRSALHAEAVHRRLYVEAWAALGLALFDELVSLQQLRLLSTKLARAPPAARSDVLADIAARGDDSVEIGARVRHGFRVGPCGAKFDGGPRCVPVPEHAIGNLGDGHRVHNTTVLDRFAPAPETAFSGVYHVDSGQVLMRPSGSTTLRTGEAAPGAVDRFGGHGTLGRELETLTGAERGRNIGFVAFYDEGGRMSVGWRSRSVNSANWGDIAAPAEHRDPAMRAIADALGIDVVSR